MNKKLIYWYLGGASYDSDYQAWLTQIVADGGTQPSASVKTAQNALVVALKAASMWTRIKTMYFLHAGDVTTCRRNVKSPSTFRLTDVNGVTFSEGNGCKSNGSTTYFNQGYKSNQYVGQHTDLTAIQYISESSTSNISGASHGMRTATAGANCRMQLTPKVSTNGTRTHYENAAAASWANSNHKGRYIQTYNSGKSIVYKDGSSVASVAVTPVASDIAADRLILARNQDPVGGSPSPVEFYTIYVAYDILMDTVTAGDVATIDALLATYNTSAGLP